MSANSTDSQGGNTSKLTPDHEAMLHQVKLFSGLSSQELNILEKGKEVWFEAGDKILAEGEHETFYALLDGKVEVILRDGAKRSGTFIIRIRRPFRRASNNSWMV